MKKADAMKMALAAAGRLHHQMLMVTPKAPHTDADWDVMRPGEEQHSDHVRAVVWPDGGIDWQQPMNERTSK